jgi:hypothetical protein
MIMMMMMMWVRYAVRLRLWSVVTTEHIVHPPGDILVWRTMVEWYKQGKADSSTTDLW